MKIQEFIKNNDISLEEGNRNTSIVTLIGYSQHLGLSKENLKEQLEDEISEDSFIDEEIDRLWDYCAGKQYKKYWELPIASATYKF